MEIIKKIYKDKFAFGAFIALALMYLVILFADFIAPYSNYFRVYNNFYPLYSATIRHGIWSGNTNFGYKEIVLNGDSGYWVMLQYNCYYYEVDNVWYTGTYTMNGSGTHQYNCRYAKNGSQDGVDNGSTFTISKSGNMTIYDLFGNTGAGKGCVTAHFTGIPVN